jgi:hypothetical protein
MAVLFMFVRVGNKILQHHNFTLDFLEKRKTLKKPFKCYHIPLRCCGIEFCALQDASLRL